MSISWMCSCVGTHHVYSLLGTEISFILWHHPHGNHHPQLTPSSWPCRKVTFQSLFNHTKSVFIWPPSTWSCFSPYEVYSGIRGRIDFFFSSKQTLLHCSVKTFSSFIKYLRYLLLFQYFLVLISLPFTGFRMFLSLVFFNGFCFAGVHPRRETQTKYNSP